MRIILNIIILFVSFSAFAQHAEIKHLGSGEFKMAMDSCVDKVILDIRPESFTGNFKIEGALVAANCSKLERVLDTVDFDTPLFFYCVEGVRSKKGCIIAQEKGFQYIFNLKKGVNHYKKQGYPVVDASK